MAKKFDPKDTELYQYLRIYIDQPQLWPFKETSVEKFLQESERLLKLYHYRESRRLVATNPTLKTSAEAYMDMTSGASFRMYKCIQSLKFEVADKEMFSLDKWDDGATFDMMFDHGREIAENLKTLLYKYNNEICDELAPELLANKIAPRYIDMETERNYVIDSESTFAVQAAENHYIAVEAAYGAIDDLIKYGLPADTLFIKIKDSVTGAGQIKLNNQTIVNNLLNSEADLEIVEKYILPEIKRGLKVFKHKARYEEKHHVAESDMKDGQLKTADPYYFRNGYKTYQDAQNAIKTALSQMRAKESMLKSSYVISIVKNPNDDTYTLTAKWSAGKKTTKKHQKKVTKTVSKNSTVTKQNNYQEKTFSVKIGSSSRKMYEETRKRSACKLGYENEQELAGEKVSLSNTFKAYILRRELRHHRRTKVAGKKERSTTANITMAEVSEEAKYKRKREDQEDKEFSLIKATGTVGKAQGSVVTKHGIPTIGGSISAAEAGLTVAEVASVTASAGKLGYSTDAGLKTIIKDTIVNKALGDETPVSETAKNYLENLSDKLQNVSVSGPKISGSFSVNGITIDSASCDAKEVKIKHRMPEIEEAKNKAIENVKSWFEQNEADCQTTDPIGIDPDFLPDEDMDMDAISDIDETIVNQESIDTAMEELNTDIIQAR